MPVSSMVVLIEFGTTLWSLPLVILIRWVEQPDAAESAVCNSSLEALTGISISLGSFRMGLPAFRSAMHLGYSLCDLAESSG